MDHVGIGTDLYRGIPPNVVNWENNTVRRYPEKTDGMSYEQHNIQGYADYDAIFAFGDDLRAAGFADEDVGKLLGGNVARVIRAVLPSRGDGRWRVKSPWLSTQWPALRPSTTPRP